MARDYKPRTNRRRHKNTSPKVTWWRWLLAAMLIVGFIYFLTSLRDSVPEKIPVTLIKALPVKPSKQLKKTPEKKLQTEAELIEPQFDFYEILEGKEIRIPDYEIKTRAREEKVGKAIPAQYILQVGAFREYKQADKLKARLAFMGIESKIEKAQVANVVWNRLKIGPYATLSTIERVRSQLKQKGITTIVMEVKG